MRTESWSQTQLELAAEAILAELEGRERRTQRERYLPEGADAEQFLRVIAAAAAQTVEQHETTEAAETVVKRNTGAALEYEAAESGVRASAQADEEVTIFRMREPRAAAPSAAAETPETDQQRIPIGGRQQTLHTISDWIERESRRYDGGFTIF